MREPMSPGRRRSIGQLAESAVNRTDVEDLLRVCAEDVPALLQDLDGADRLRDDLRELNVLRRDMGAVQAERDKALDDAGTAQDEVERLRAQQAEANSAHLAVLKTGHETGLALQKAEVERDTAVATVEKALADVKTIAAERDEAREQVEIERGRGNGYANQVVRVKQVRVWHNEDGKGFVFADDLFAALNGTAASDA